MMEQFYHIVDLLEITEEIPHFTSLAYIPPTWGEEEIFKALDELTEHLKPKIGSKMPKEKIKKEISAWIDEKIKEKQRSPI
jgi:hypothetical protein